MVRATVGASELSTVESSEVILAFANSILTYTTSTAVIHARRDVAGKSRITIFAETFAIKAVAVLAASWEALAFGTRDTREGVLANADTVLTNTMIRALVWALSVTAVNASETLIAVAMAINTDTIMVTVCGATDLGAVNARIIRLALASSCLQLAFPAAGATIGTRITLARYAVKLRMADTLARRKVACSVPAAIERTVDDRAVLAVVPVITGTCSVRFANSLERAISDTKTLSTIVTHPALKTDADTIHTDPRTRTVGRALAL